CSTETDSPSFNLFTKGSRRSGSGAAASDFLRRRRASGFRRLQLDHQIEADGLDGFPERGGPDRFRAPQLRAGLEEAFAGPRRVGAVGGQFEDVDAEPGERAGDRPDDPLAVLADDLQVEAASVR